jgi:hypothetical protein
MARDPLALLVQRVMTDPSFVDRARTDLEGTLAAEGISLGPSELAAARAFQSELAGLSVGEVGARLAVANAAQGLK